MVPAGNASDDSSESWLEGENSENIGVWCFLQSNTKSSVSNICLHPSLRCNGRVNCPTSGSSDEFGCQVESIIPMGDTNFLNFIPATMTMDDFVQMIIYISSAIIVIILSIGLFAISVKRCVKASKRMSVKRQESKMKKQLEKSKSYCCHCSPKNEGIQNPILENGPQFSAIRMAESYPHFNYSPAFRNTSRGQPQRFRQQTHQQAVPRYQSLPENNYSRLNQQFKIEKMNDGQFPPQRKGWVVDSFPQRSQLIPNSPLLEPKRHPSDPYVRKPHFKVETTTTETSESDDLIGKRQVAFNLNDSIMSPMSPPWPFKNSQTLSSHEQEKTSNVTGLIDEMFPYCLSEAAFQDLSQSLPPVAFKQMREQQKNDNESMGTSMYSYFPSVFSPEVDRNSRVRMSSSKNVQEIDQTAPNSLDESTTNRSSGNFSGDSLILSPKNL